MADKKKVRIPVWAKGDRPSAEPTKVPAPLRGKDGGSSSSGGGRSGSGSSGSGGRSGGGGGGGGGSSYSAIQKKQNKNAGEAELRKAKDLEAQVAAIMYALEKAQPRARRQNIADVEKALTSQLDEAKADALLRAEGFFEAIDSTEQSASATSAAGYANMAREQQESMTQLLSNGAGESDLMRSMLMAARNWHANASENNRAYYDSMGSATAGLNDLSLDTKTGMANAFRSAEGEKDRLWQEYYRQRSESYTNLGNIRGQQMLHYRAAESYEVKPKKGKTKETSQAAEDAFLKAAKATGKSYKQKDLPEWISDYRSAEAPPAQQQGNSRLSGAVALDTLPKAEGAVLRKWEGEL